MNRIEDDSLHEFDRYVMNDIPIRFIRLSDMRFVGRNDLRKHFRTSLPEWAVDYPSVHVKYAIMSHRWLDDMEPTYKEVEEGTATGPGYEKLKKFCEKARQYGMEFAWSDTCCIDKSSSTELDESIRSMFRWYSNSAICIVHLAQSETIEHITDDEWMKRGWTLQELLAPDQIKLFNMHWIPMTDDRNDKSIRRTEVMKTLGRTTGISHDDLCGFRPGTSEVDKQMTWAAKRKTTRVEDVAYSLMGIFDVSLQIAYGEGGDRAFCRLIEAIMQAGDASVLNWKGKAATHHTSRAIPRSPQNFVGYRNLEFGNMRLEMTMTNLGLRMPLVILPLNFCSSMSVQQGTFRLTLNCPLCPTIKIDIDTNDCNFLTYQYALGIVNYLLISHRSCEVPGIRGKSGGFILFRQADHGFHSPIRVCKPRPTDFVGLKFVSSQETRFTKWKLVDGVGLVQVDFPNIRSRSVFLVDHEYLQSVYL
ncbi:heterokaryon incompatibility protein-domain-containing protein [Suillus americanus]|nr:heterokaryon incompatibility protein-domain-containing protein [Suillus americanus]